MQLTSLECDWRDFTRPSLVFCCLEGCVQHVCFLSVLSWCCCHIVSCLSLTKVWDISAQEYYYLFHKLFSLLQLEGDTACSSVFALAWSQGKKKQPAGTCFHGTSCLYFVSRYLNYDTKQLPFLAAYLKAETVTRPSLSNETFSCHFWFFWF